jgi:hypothetical protein
MAAEGNIREKERMIEQKQQHEVKLQRGREEEARPAKEDPPLFFLSREERSGIGRVETGALPPN